MGCTPCTSTPCDHCDRPCTSIMCAACRATRYGTAAAVAQLVRTPRPADHVTHDLASTPDGAIGRCEHCAGRTYQIAGQPWCPRPFCP